eukprot:NODE_161_length_16629_cov_0.427344.p1 type:complete len:470 gc:universal NODE_161_length_16629_cov_0.427344:3246-1837(-)
MSNYYADDFESTDETSKTELYIDDFEEYQEEKLILTKSSKIIHIQIGDFSYNKAFRKYDAYTQTDEFNTQATQVSNKLLNQGTQAPEPKMWNRVDEKIYQESQLSWNSELLARAYILDSIMSSKLLHYPQISAEAFTQSELYSRKIKCDKIIYDHSVLGRCFSYTNGTIFKSDEEIFCSKSSFSLVEGLWLNGDFYFLANTRSNILKVIKFNPFNKSNFMNKSALVNEIKLPSELTKIIKLGLDIHLIFLDGYCKCDAISLFDKNTSLDFIEYNGYVSDSTICSDGLITCNSHAINLPDKSKLFSENAFNDTPISHLYVHNKTLFLQTIVGDIFSLKHFICHSKGRALKITSWNAFYVVVFNGAIRMFDRNSQYRWEHPFENCIDYCFFQTIEDVHLGILVTQKFKKRLVFTLYKFNKDIFDDYRNSYLNEELVKNEKIKALDDERKNKRLENENRIELTKLITVYEDN